MGCKRQIPTGREYSNAWDSPWFDDRNDHSYGPVRSGDDILQGKGIVEDVIGEVYEAGKFSSVLDRGHGKR